MKKLLTIILTIVLILPAAALSETATLSDYSVAELEYMLAVVRNEILSRYEYGEVTVPPGHYVVGEDIPAGHWTIKYAPGEIGIVSYFKEANTTGIEPADTLYDFNGWNIGDPEHDLGSLYNNREIDLQLTEGYHLNVEIGSVVFVPFAGRTSPFFN